MSARTKDVVNDDGKTQPYDTEISPTVFQLLGRFKVDRSRSRIRIRIRSHAELRLTVY